MIVYKSETHDYSNWPYWYRAYGSDFRNPSHALITKRNEISRWLKQIKIDAKVDSNGYTYRFWREADRTLFLLRWA